MLLSAATRLGRGLSFSLLLLFSMSTASSIPFISDSLTFSTDLTLIGSMCPYNLHAAPSDALDELTK